jgi:hypothetical protein
MGAGDILDVDETKRLTRNSTVIVIARRRDQRFSQVAAADESNPGCKIDLGCFVGVFCKSQRRSRLLKRNNVIGL